MGGVGTLVVVEGDPASDASLGLRPGFPGVKIDAFVFQGPPESLDKDVVEVSGFAVHALRGSACLHAREGRS